jgi:hypothetical protein
MQPITVTVGPLASADDAAVAASQDPAGAGDLTLTSSVVVLDQPRRVIITSASDDTAFTFTIYGTTFSGQVVSEAVAGANAGIASSTLDFKTVTRVAVSGNAGSVKVGTNGVAGSRWVRLDSWADAQTAIQCNATGTVNYTVQVTMDDPNDPVSPVSAASVTWINSSDTDAVGANSDIFTEFAYTPTFARVLLNSGTGSVSAVFSQFNVVNK